MANAESAIEALYEDAAVRDSLQDAEASTLLRWGEDQIMRLAEQTDDEAAFDALLDKLRGLLKGVNRFVGERVNTDALAQTHQLDKLLETGQELGAPPAAAASSLAPAFATGDDASTLQALLALLTPVDGAAQAVPSAEAPSARPTDALNAATLTDESAQAAQLPAPDNAPALPEHAEEADESAETPSTPADETPSAPKPRWSTAAFGFPPAAPAPNNAPDNALTGDTPQDDETQDDWFE